MARYSNDEIILIVQLFYANNKSMQKTIRKFATKKCLKSKLCYPNELTIRNLISKFERTGSIEDLKRSGRKTISKQTISKVNTALQNGNLSVRQIGEKVHLPRSTVHNILRNKLKLFPYKVQKGAYLKEDQKKKRLNFCNKLLEKDLNDKEYIHNVLWTDEANFYLNGYVNRQNARVWGKQKPNVSVQNSKFAKRITVFVGLTSTFIIGPYFFEENGKPCNVNAQ